MKKFNFKMIFGLIIFAATLPILTYKIEFDSNTISYYGSILGAGIASLVSFAVLNKTFEKDSEGHRKQAQLQKEIQSMSVRPHFIIEDFRFLEPKDSVKVKERFEEESNKLNILQEKLKFNKKINIPEHNSLIVKLKNIGLNAAINTEIPVGIYIGDEISTKQEEITPITDLKLNLIKNCNSTFCIQKNQELLIIFEGVSSILYLKNADDPLKTSIEIKVNFSDIYGKKFQQIIEYKKNHPEISPVSIGWSKN